MWLTQSQMANLFGRDEKTVRKHINNVFREEELSKGNNTHFLRVDGVKQSVAFYSLNVIISVGYRVKSPQGVKFRQWATSVLKQYLIKGYAINQQLKLDRYDYQSLSIGKTTKRPLRKSRSAPLTTMLWRQSTP